jgi:hypothetical protein
MYAEFLHEGKRPRKNSIATFNMGKSEKFGLSDD